MERQILALSKLFVLGCERDKDFIEDVNVFISKNCHENVQLWTNCWNNVTSDMIRTIQHFGIRLNSNITKSMSSETLIDVILKKQPKFGMEKAKANTILFTNLIKFLQQVRI